MNNKQQNNLEDVTRSIFDVVDVLLTGANTAILDICVKVWAITFTSTTVKYNDGLESVFHGQAQKSLKTLFDRFWEANCYSSYHPENQFQEREYKPLSALTIFFTCPSCRANVEHGVVNSNQILKN